MRKIYISICFLVISVIAIAQVQSTVNQIDYKQVFNQNEFLNAQGVSSSNSMNSASPVNIIWESDFSDPSDWVLDNSGQNPPDYGWSIDAISNGWWSSNGINSTSGGNFAELSNGDASVGTQAGGVVYTMTTALPIDVYGAIGSSDATLSFEEYGARFYDLQEVQISTDGTNFVTVADNMIYSRLTNLGGDPYTNPTLRQINLCSYLGNNPTSVWIRFSWTSALDLPVTDQYYYNTWITYGWYIDDVQIAESPANRITMEEEVIGGFWLDYLNYTGSGLNYMVGLDYSVTPLSQLQNHPYSIEAVVKNEGTAEQHVELAYDVTGTVISNSSSAGVVLNPCDSVLLAASFSPTVTGPYSIDISAVADSAGAGITTTVSNIENRNIEVTDYIYGKDLGLPTSNSWVIGGPSDQWHLTTRYEMYANEQLYALRVYITDESVVGAEVKAIIYELDTTATNGLMFLDESDPYTIQGLDLGSWVDIPFVSPITLLNGYAYEFGIAGFQHPSDSVSVGMSGEAMYNGEHSLFDELGLNPNDPANIGTPTWYYITSTPMVRMSFDASTPTAVSNFKQTVFNVYPNPSNGIFSITLDDNKGYDITVNNVLGQTVLETTSSEINTIIDLTSFNKGIYTIELRTQNQFFSEKVILE
ncbi:MAG: hypothetical protein CMD16_02230 [Flavobacteriales bacterium]|nr:hypothetical protein [Flavobacteriales bacterium]|tara:strand:- start:49025 stop:50959 length:1935 start_codon:yes stop_codon:yes gene_type:complete